MCLSVIVDIWFQTIGLLGKRCVCVYIYIYLLFIFFFFTATEKQSGGKYYSLTETAGL